MIRGIRGAITVENNTAEEIKSASVELLGTIIERNNINEEDLISIIFTMTPDLTAAFPAAAAREMGIVDVPLLDMAEPAVDGMLERCIRILIHTESDMDKKEIEHVYLRKAACLRPDLVKNN